MKMEYWIMNSDHNLWNIVLNGNSRKKTRRDPKGNIMILPPVSVEEHIAVQRETKARTILLQSLPEDHMADFHHLDDARDIWLAVKARFDLEELRHQMQDAMLFVRINRFEKKAGRKMKFNNKDAARYSSFKLKELDKSEEPKALLSVDSMLNWSDHEGEDVENGAASRIMGKIAGAEG
ncbi:hypothetical protein Tco_0655059 [Tanacetum coccineum]|uniref:Xylulose kinase-1 n=1 Tax=Tanacetum coccineum TaxID=301880 RepID=A0ABQ4X5L3_9ASTR